MSEPAAPLSSPSHLAGSRSGAVTLLIVSTAALLYGVAAWVSPPLVGLYHDDGIYVESARGLARGEGYRIAHLPATPHQTKYPPLFPVLLTPVAWWSGGDASDLTLFQWPSLLATLAALALIPGLVRRWGFSDRAALGVTALCALSPLLFQYSRLALSETPYLLLTLASLRLLPVSGEAPSSRRFLAAGVAAACAVLCRSIGLALIPALALTAWARRRERGAWIPLALGALAFTCWWWISTTLRGVESARGLGPLYDYYLGYGVWREPSLSLLVRVAGENLRLVLTAVGDVCLGWRVAGIPHWQWPAAALGACSLMGWLRIARAAPTETVYLMATLATILVYPFDGARYLVPLTPFLVAGLWVGASSLLARAPRAVAPVGLAMLAASSLAVDLARFPSAESLPLLNRRFSAPAFQAGADWLRRNSAAGDIVVSAHDPWIHLATGRKAIPAGVYDHFWSYAEAGSEIDGDAIWRESYAAARQQGARWVFVSDHWHPVFRTLWLRYMQAQPGRFALRFEAGADGVAIWELLPEPDQGATMSLPQVLREASASSASGTSSSE